jgi:sulfur carrier protein
MNVVLNGDKRVLADGASVRDAVRLLVDGERGVVVSVDGAIVPRSAWDATLLVGGSHVEVLHAAAGG